MRKRKKKSKILVKYSPINFFEGCRQRGKAKRDQGEMQIYKGVGTHSMVKSFLKIGGRVFETKLACNAPPVLQIFNNSKKLHVLKTRIIKICEVLYIKAL